MSRAKKTPPFIIEMLRRHADSMDWIDELIRVKTTVPVENQANHIKEHDVDYFIGVADGRNAMMEEALHSYGCYGGFQYVGKKVRAESGNEYYPTIRPGHADYASWRRVYMQRG